jgi:hypothetical protein
LAHPCKHELMAFAESMVDNQATVNAQLAAHVNSCATCTCEVRAIRATLKAVAGAPALEPSPEFTADLLRAAQKARAVPPAAQRGAVGAAVAVAKGAAVAAALVMAASISFSAALSEPQPERRAEAAVAPVAVAAAPAEEAGLDASQVLREIQIFAAAISVGHGPVGPWEREQLRSVVALDAELQAAMEALEKNPGSARASHVYHANLQRKAKTLKSVFQGN